MRVHLQGDEGAADFARKLLSIGDGTHVTDGIGRIDLTRDLCITVPTLDSLIDSVFPNLAANMGNISWLRERAILAPKNDIVDSINIRIQDRLRDRVTRYYFSVDTMVDEEEAVQYPIEFLNSLSPAGVPPHELGLKIGSPIILLRNLSPPRLVNGTRLRVLSLHNNVIEATILGGTFSGSNVFIPRIPLIPDDLFLRFKRVQFPVRLAFAMTVNKSQGQTIRYVGLDLTTQCFSHGQFYVACSRVGRPSNLFVLAPENKAKNVVYQQALR